MSEAPPLAPARRPLPPIFWILVALTLILLAIGVGSIAYYIHLTYGPTPALWEDPWDMPQPERISAGLAVWSLAGIAPDQVYRYAMAQDELDTVAAMALLTPQLPSNQRLGWIDVLAQRFHQADREADARIFLQRTTDLAMVLPDLTDSLRADILLDAATRWADLGDQDQAQWVLEQTLILAQYSPELNKTTRKNLFIAIGNQYTQLGNPTRGEAIAAIPVLSEGIPTPTPPILTPIYQPPTRPASLTQLIQQRQEAAQAYVDDWSRRGGQAAAGATRNLENHLIDEDLARSVYYDESLAQEAISPDEYIRVLFDRVIWNAIKYRAASHLYGASITPTWEADRMNIGIALRDAIVALHNQSNTWVASLPPDQQPETRVALDRLILGWDIVGLYVGANRELLANTLNQDIQTLDRTGVFPQATYRRGQIQIELIYHVPPSGNNDTAQLP